MQGVGTGGGYPAVGAAPSPPSRRPGHWFPSLPPLSTRSPPFLPPSPPLSSPSPSPLKRAGSALASCSRRAVRAGGAVSLSRLRWPTRQSRKQAEQCAAWRWQRRHRRHRQPRQPGQPKQPQKQPPQHQLLRRLRAVAVEPATAIAVSVEPAEAFSLFHFPLHSTLEATITG